MCCGYGEPIKLTDSMMILVCHKLITLSDFAEKWKILLSTNAFMQWSTTSKPKHETGHTYIYGLLEVWIFSTIT